MTSFYKWLVHKWGRAPEPTLADAYNAAFKNEHGARVLQHLLDSVYCTVYEGNDPIMCVTHNARRTVVHEILTNIDIGEHPEKYIITPGQLAEVLDGR